MPSETPSNESERFSWKKWAQGIFNPLTTAKTTALIAHIAILTAIFLLILWIGVQVKKFLFPSNKTVPAISNVADSHIDTGNDKKFQLGLFNS